MEKGQGSSRITGNAKYTWLRYLLIALVCEKIIQHTFVTLAFYFNWQNIDSTVAVNPTLLMIAGAILAVLFVFSLWELISKRKWSLILIGVLALCDIFGEFIVQGRIYIDITVSFLVAVILLFVAAEYRRIYQRM